MATSNRAALINRTLRILKKHYTPVPAPKDRTLFEHLMFACLLENSPFEAAEQVFATLRTDYFDWNEVRVSTARELAEVTKPLVDSSGAANRLKQTLHAVFEAVYQFDLESLKKKNIGEAAKQLQKLNGSTPFVVSYVTQMALGGHAIPINHGLLVGMEVVGVISESEAKAGAVPGLERAIPKNKGTEYGSLMHQFGVEIGRSPYGPTARKLLLEIDPNCKSRLPKRQVPVPPPAPPAKPIETKAKPGAKAEIKGKDAKHLKGAKAEAASVPIAKKGQRDRGIDKKKPAAKRPEPTKRPTKPGTKTPTSKKKPTTHKLTKRKPR
jgi:endonuclease III